jgi:phosphoglycerol transferase MdoB-like AlkP superfamily enzyme
MQSYLQKQFHARSTAGAALVTFLVFVSVAERNLSSLPLSMLLALIMAGFAFVVSRRPRFSALGAMVLLGALTVLSAAKYKFMAIKLHVIDVWFYVLGSDTTTYLIDQFPLLVFGALLGGALGVMVLVAAYRWDKPLRGYRLPATLGTLFAILLLPITVPTDAGTYLYYISKDRFVSAFFVSFRDVGRLLEPSPLNQHLAGVDTTAPFLRGAGCEMSQAPDIVLVLSESAVPPAQVPGMKHDPSIMPYFESFDGKLHRAGVETHGGGTWISESSVMSGLSMADFGWMRSYPTMLLRDRLKTGLPASLAACGYATAMISPASYRFVNTGPMMASLGIREFVDRFRMNAKTQQEPDSFYYRHALDFMDRHRQENDRPLFLFVESTAAHSPYDFRFEPGRTARGEPFGNDPLTDEYLRRLTFAQEDYADFVAKLRERRRPVLAVQFGDHHPYLTARTFFTDAAAQADFSSAAYQTFYAMTPIGFEPAAPLPEAPVLDLAYLGTTIMEVAGVPLDPPSRARQQMRDQCAGRFHTCKARHQVDAYLTRLVASGLIVQP